jgi:DNA-binding NtrC family response regulator
MITDQVMPIMTGTELIDAVRAEWPHLRVILASGYAELPSGTDPALPKLAKPYRQEMLARIIAEQSSASQSETILRFCSRPKPEQSVG